MTFDPRCCGSGTCIVDPDGRCWCGQQWDGEKMCNPPPLARSGADERRQARGSASDDGADEGDDPALRRGTP